MFTRAGGADVSLRDVIITQMGNGARVCGWRHAPEARIGFGGFWKSQLVELSSASGEDVWLSLTRRSQGSGLVAGATREGGCRWKSQNRKNVYLSPYVEEPLNLKVIKKFPTWTKKSSSVFRVSGFPCSMYICYEHMYVSHIAVSGHGTFALAKFNYVDYVFWVAA